MRRIVRAEVAFAFADDAYRVSVADAVEIAGALMPDRECCSMPFNVWYEPFDGAVAKPIVGAADLSCRDDVLGRRFTLRGANCVLAGEWGEQPKN